MLSDLSQESLSNQQATLCSTAAVHIDNCLNREEKTRCSTDKTGRAFISNFQRKAAKHWITFCLLNVLKRAANKDIPPHVCILSLAVAEGVKIVANVEEATQNRV